MQFFNSKGSGSWFFQSANSGDVAASLDRQNKKAIRKYGAEILLEDMFARNAQPSFDVPVEEPLAQRLSLQWA